MVKADAHALSGTNDILRATSRCNADSNETSDRRMIRRTRRHDPDCDGEILVQLEE